MHRRDQRQSGRREERPRLYDRCTSIEARCDHSQERSGRNGSADWISDGMRVLADGLMIGVTVGVTVRVARSSRQTHPPPPSCPRSDARRGMGGTHAGVDSEVGSQIFLAKRAWPLLGAKRRAEGCGGWGCRTECCARCYTQRTTQFLPLQYDLTLPLLHPTM